MREVSTSTMAEDGDMHKDKANEVPKHQNYAKMRLLSTRTMQMRELSTSTMAEDGDKHKNNANEVPKHTNYAK